MNIDSIMTDIGDYYRRMVNPHTVYLQMTQKVFTTRMSYGERVKDYEGQVDFKGGTKRLNKDVHSSSKKFLVL